MITRTATSKAAALLASLILAACGGGSDNPGNATVTVMNASGVAYSRTMTVTVSGSHLDDPGLQMTVDGPCENIVKLAGAVDYQAGFTCTVTGVGTISPRIRNADGLELGRLTTTVPTPQVTMNARQGTTTGSVVIELDPVAAPITVRNFLSYVNAGFYTNTIFHRVLANQLVQGGGFTTGPTFKPATSLPIVLESSSGLKNLRGTIGMARTSDPDTATTQFFFNLADNSAFDYVDSTTPGYAVFGKVVSGLADLDRLGGVPIQSSTNFPALPATDVVITAAVQTR